MIIDIHHVQLAMPEGKEEAARQFYGVILGLEEIEKPSNLKRRGGVWFALSTRQIHLGVQADFRPATKAHVAFVVEDLDLIRSRLQQVGCPILSDEPLPGYEGFYSADPFGNRLEFLVPTRSSNQLVYVETGG